MTAAREDRSGQLAADLIPADDDRGAVRLTSELDLLMATASEEELDWCDWKSGWKWWTATDVRDAFQFQMHAWLIFHRFPTVSRINCRVFMTREGFAPRRWRSTATATSGRSTNG
jgi:hypothetical protein